MVQQPGTNDSSLLLLHTIEEEQHHLGLDDLVEIRLHGGTGAELADLRWTGRVVEVSSIVVADPF